MEVWGEMREVRGRAERREVRGIRIEESTNSTKRFIHECSRMLWVGWRLGAMKAERREVRCIRIEESINLKKVYTCVCTVGRMGTVGFPNIQNQR